MVALIGAGRGRVARGAGGCLLEVGLVLGPRCGTGAVHFGSGAVPARYRSPGLTAFP